MTDHNSRKHLLLRFEYMIPIIIALSYGAIQISQATGMFSPSLKATTKAFWQYKANVSKIYPSSHTQCVGTNTWSYNDLNQTHIFIPEIPNVPDYNQRHQKGARQLAVLEKIGFLDKLPDPIPVTVQYRGQSYIADANAYRLTPKGKAYTLGNRGLCLNYGDAKFLGIQESVEQTDSRKLDYYKEQFENVQKSAAVTANIGFNSTKDFYSWAQDPEVIEAFELNKHLNNQVYYNFIQINHEWMPEEVLQNNFSMANWISQKNSPPTVYSIYTDNTAQTGFPFEQKIQQHYDESFQERRPSYAIPLPGIASQYPTDISSDSRCLRKYRPGILLDQHPDHADDRKAITHSLPYLKDMEARGILVSKIESVPFKDKNNQTQNYRVQLFEPTEKYQDAFAVCGNLGTVQSYKLLSARYDQNLNQHDAVIIQYLARPAWATDELIQEWDELRFPLEYGLKEYNTPFEIKDFLQKRDYFTAY